MTGDPRDAEQKKQKLLAVVLMKDIFNVLNKTRGSDPCATGAVRKPVLFISR